MVEALRVARRLRTVTFDPPPVIIVGHWRSGTTLLYNLMSRDPAFCFPRIDDALRPYDFYPGGLEVITRWLVRLSLPATRPMDDIPLSSDLPQEDEIALATMGVPSFMNCFYFPRQISKIFAEEVLFQGADSSTVRSWGDALVYYLAKLAVLNPGRRLLLKSPAHSARIPQLRALFPGAKFIHIHRNPADVFHSTRKLYQSILPLCALQDYEPSSIDDHIIWAYPQLINRLLDGLAQVPPTHLTTVSYDELVAAPTQTLERIYRELALGEFDRVRASIEAYPARIAPRRSTGHVDRPTASRLESLWAPVLARLGYSQVFCEGA